MCCKLRCGKSQPLITHSENDQCRCNSGCKKSSNCTCQKHGISCGRCATCATVQIVSTALNHRQKSEKNLLFLLILHKFITFQASGLNLERINCGYKWQEACSLQAVIDVIRNHPFAGTTPIESLMRNYWIDNINKNQKVKMSKRSNYRATINISSGFTTREKPKKKNGKSQDTLSPYSNSGDHQFIPLKFWRRRFGDNENFPKRSNKGLWRGAANQLNPWAQGSVSSPLT